MITRAIALFFIAFSVLSHSLKVFSEPITIKGFAAEAGGMKAELLYIGDFISNNLAPLGETEIGQDGFFKFTPELKKTTFAYLIIGIQRADLLLEPGQSYDLRITGLLSEELRSADIPPFQVPPLQIEIFEPWRYELNGLVRSFWGFHENFMAEHATSFIGQRNPSIAQQYATELYNQFPGIDNAWFNDMLNYKIAGIEMMLRTKGREALAREYILNREILYDHMFYMDFFKQFWHKYLNTSRLYERRQLIAALNSNDAYSSFMELMAKDPLLENKPLRELVLLAGVKDLMGVPGTEPQAITRLLEQIKNSSEITEHQIIAENLHLRMSQG